jgi:O-antigen/teichoic acid export membrane protein
MPQIKNFNLRIIVRGAKLLFIKYKSSKALIDIQWAFISLSMSAFLNFIIRILIGKDLGVSVFGLYTLTFTIYMFAAQFANFGIGSALMKYISEYDEENVYVKKIVSAGMASSLIMSSIMAIILYFLSDVIAIYLFHNPDMGFLIKLTSFCIPFLAIQKSVLGALNGLRKMFYYAIINIILNLFILVATFILVKYINMGVIGATLGFVVPTILVGIGSLFLIKNNLDINELFNSTFKMLTLFGFYVMIGNSISTLNTQIDTLLIGVFLNDTQVGYYAVAAMLIQGIILIPSAIQIRTGPTLSYLSKKNDIDGIKKAILNVIKNTLILMLFISVLLIISGRYLIDLFFTNEFSAAYIPLIILTIGYSIYSCFVSIGSVFASVGKVKLSFKINFVCMLINIILNIILIPIMGIIGAAIATTISLIITTLINMYILKHVLNNL